METKLFPFEGWIFYKVYCNPNSADQIITDLNQQVKSFLKNNKSVPFFFIRYYDVDFHLRLRYKISEPQLTQFNRFLLDEFGKMKQRKIVYHLTIDSYDREVRRYTTENIEIIESIFSLDTKAVINFLDKNESPISDWEYALLVLNDYFKMFEISKLDSINLLILMFNRLDNTNSPERNKSLRIKLDKSYRHLKDRISDLLNNFQKGTNEGLKNGSLYSNQKLELIKTLNFSSWEEKINVVSSIIHMAMNRIFSLDINRQETIIYYYLMKQLKTDLNYSKRKRL